MTVEWLDPDLRRIKAPNASALTGSGTNTYVLGRGVVTVIDPGPNDQGHLRAILSSLTEGETVGAILVTHAHLDHSGLADLLSSATGAATHGFGPAHSGRSALMQSLAEAGLTPGGEGFDLAFRPNHLLRDGQTLAAGDLQIEVMATPGHTGCHLSFAHEGRLFCGDHVMGWSTSLISPPDGDMAAYLDSLARLGARVWRIAHPGHGDPVSDPAARIAELRSHRLAREAAFFAALEAKAQSITDLTRQVYTALPEPLRPAAERNVLAHLIKLWHEDRITADPAPGPQAIYRRKL